VPAILVAGIWYIYLFVAMPENQTVWQSVVGQLRHTFSDENPQAWWFVWLVALPVSCIVLSIAYLLNAARTRTSRLSLFVAAIALVIATFVLNDWDLALFVALPALWGYRAIYAT
jgi:hypothetical protein